MLELLLMVQHSTLQAHEKTSPYHSMMYLWHSSHTEAIQNHPGTKPCSTLKHYCIKRQMLKDWYMSSMEIV